MPVKIMHRYTRQLIASTPKTLYVFGDNLARRGYGGQAGAARDEPNAVGIPTLIDCGVPASPDNFHKFKWPVRKAFWKLKLHLMLGGEVVWPEDGVGTGIADLQGNCPELLDLIMDKFHALWEEYGEVDVNP